MYMQHQRQTNTAPQIRGEGMRRDRCRKANLVWHGWLHGVEGESQGPGSREAWGGGVAWRRVAGEEREEKGERAK